MLIILQLLIGQKMKKLWLFFVLFYLPFTLSNGVGVINSSTGTYLQLQSNTVEVTVDNQVAIITTTETFRNNTQGAVNFKFAFPMPEGASATGMSYYINGQWHSASFSAGNPDTTLPGPGTINENLKTYLGNTPFYFDPLQQLKKDSICIFKFVYVQLLKYYKGKIEFNYPNDYHLIQSGVFNLQELKFNLTSQRTIDSLIVFNHTPVEITKNSHDAFVHIQLVEQPADKNYKIQYLLNQTEMGLSGLSSMFPDSLVADSSFPGFFMIAVEPNPQSAIAMNKVFTLIIDRSGSMGWDNKIEQARNAASYIVNNLNEGDKFNIISFSDLVSSFQPQHVFFNPQTKADALTYINGLTATGSTDISAAFSTAIPQFAGYNDSTAKIVIFLTDGLPTAGITDYNQLVNHINTLVHQTDTTINIFSFGIGSDVDPQLLSVISNNSNGFASFLENNELETAITDFYDKVRNPVMLYTKAEFSPNVVYDIAPFKLPNLYRGEQLLISGRYNEAVNLNVSLSGKRFGVPVNYQYQFPLADSCHTNYLFLTKVWAKLKIESLLINYYALNPNSAEALLIKQQIIKLSVKFGVSSPFTNLTGNTTGGIKEETASKNKNITPADFTLFGNYPNPFNPGTTIKFNIGKNINDYVYLRIYNILGELIKEYRLFINNPGDYQIYWDGKDSNGRSVTSGNYIYVLSYKNTVLAGKMNLIK
jgi:Ca-activated chloride channel family protein